MGTALSDGSYNVQVTAKDNAGNSGDTTGTLVIDTVAPTATVNALDTNNNEPTLTGTVNDAAPSSGIAGVTVLVNGQTLNATVSGTTWSATAATALSDGTYTVDVTAKDNAGNSSTQATGTLVVDTVAPTATVNSLVTNKDEPTLSGTVNDAAPSSGIAGVTVVVDTQTLTAIVSGTTWSMPLTTALSDGTYTVDVTATDNAGNISTPATGTLVVTTAAPTATVNSLVTNNNEPTLTGTVNDAAPSSGIAGVTVIVDNQTLAATVSGTTWSAVVGTSLADGTYDVQVTATDDAGNSSTPATATLVVDTAAPTVAVNNLTTGSETPTLTGTVSNDISGIASVTVAVNGQTLTATVSGTTWSAAVTSPLSVGSYNVQVTATDNAGNVGTATGTLDIPLVGTWTSASDDTWYTAANWSDNIGTGAPGLGTSSGDQAIFNGDPGTETTADIGDTSPSIAALGFGSSALDYTIEATGSGQLQMNSGSSTATISVAAGTQTITAPVLLASSTLLDPADSTTLDISGTITDNSGQSLTVGDATDDGTVVLSGANGYGGGTILVNGTLLAGNTSGSATGTGNVTLDGGTLGSSTAGSIAGTVVGGPAAHVIEPGGTDIGSLAVGGLAANANTTLEFNLGSGGTASLLTLGSGGMTETGPFPSPSARRLRRRLLRDHHGRHHGVLRPRVSSPRPLPVVTSLPSTPARSGLYRPARVVATPRR